MNKLLALLLQNRSVENRRFEVLKNESQEPVIYLYDVIVSSDLEAEWWGGISPSNFLKELSSITSPVIHLRINSPGGDVFAARVMELAIRQHSSKIIAHIDGYAASAASFLAVACDEVEIAESGFFMIHKAWTMCWGNADDLNSTANLLGKIDDSLVNTYVAETGQDESQVQEWMRAETWFNAEEAIQFGFADRLAEVPTKSNLSAWNMSAYNHAPKITPEDATVIEPENTFDTDLSKNHLNTEHRIRQQQRVNMLSLTSVG